MKKYFQITGVALIVGIIMTLIGWGNKGVKPVIDNHDHFTFTAIGNNKLTRKETINNNFNKIAIQAENSDFHIHSGNRFQIKVTGVNPNAVQVKVKDDTLNIYEPRPFAINWRKINSQVDITIPKKHKLVETFVASSGNIKVDNLTMTRLLISTFTGTITVDKITTKESAIETEENYGLKTINSNLGNSALTVDRGKLTIDHCQLSAMGTSNSGDVYIANSRLLNKSQFDMDRGKFVLKNVPNLSYQLSADGKAITYMGSKPYENFIKKTSDKNLLIVNSSEGTIIIE